MPQDDEPYSAGFRYLATPYSRYPRGKDAAFQDAVAAAVICFRAGIDVYSPIAHTHPIALHGGLEGSFARWQEFDRTMIAASRGMIVVKMDGWQESTGILAEIEMCREMGKPVDYMEPDGPAPRLSYNKL